MPDTVTLADAPSDSGPGPRIATFDNSAARLPPAFFASQPPTPVAAPRLIAFNQPLAEALGLDVAAIHAAGPAAIFSGNLIPAGAQPIASAYAGHQFGNFVPQLGDGRAVLIGEVIDRAGVRRDIQLKGAGPTPFSRGGDGRAALGPVLREYLVSEAMHALGIPTTRALAAVTTGEDVFRDRVLPGAIVTRVAASHLRVGTFQFFAARRDDAAIRTLLDYAIARHYPEAANAENPASAFLDAVIGRQAALIAAWMGVGFIHGVMNTDNMAISGETIDYGPCAFMEQTDPATVFSAIDRGGRYAYANQPRIAQWNLARLAETLLPLLDPDPEAAVKVATAAIDGFSARFEAESLRTLRAKLGLTKADPADRTLIADLLALMHAAGADFTQTFRALIDAENTPGPSAYFPDQSGYTAWLTTWRDRLAHEATTPAERAEIMRKANPAFIPRNHRVEQAIEAAIESGDFTPFETLNTVLARPYDDQPGYEAYQQPAMADERVTRTFCGT